MNPIATVDIPGVRLVSEANQWDHWRDRHGRHKTQDQAVTVFLRSTIPKLEGTANLLGYAPLHVRLVRLGKRKLDPDNLAGCFKQAQDSVADFLGVDDGDETRVRWHYAQEFPRDYGLRVELWDGAPPEGGAHA